MGFLALVAFAAALGPIVFDVSPQAERGLTILEWVLVGSFAAEFCVQGAITKDRSKWIRDPWRIVDALTILGPVIALLPHVSDLASGSLMLRVLRVGRAVAFGTRAGSVKVRTRHGMADGPLGAKPNATVVRAEGDLRPVDCDSGSYLAWSNEPGPSWFHVSNLSSEGFEELAHAAEVSDEDLAQMRRENVPARVRGGKTFGMMVLHIPSFTDTDTDSVSVPHVNRTRLMMVITRQNLLTATTSAFDLQRNVEKPLQAVPQMAFQARVVSAILSFVCERNRSVVEMLEAHVHQLDEKDVGREVLTRGKELRGEISATAFDLNHTKNVVQALADGKSKLGVIDLKDEKYVDDVLTEIDSLDKAVIRTKEDLKALIEFHLDKKSFEMNSIVKLLTVVSFLALIPSIAGGLLGMNVAGNPWPVTLGQVAFCIAMLMATALYVFAVKGWLK
jgi:Mg2+ and Co2+ transporter CorA